MAMYNFDIIFHPPFFLCLCLSVSGSVEMVEGMSDRLLCDLKDVMVEHTKLTMGQKLGKGVNKLSP